MSNITLSYYYITRLNNHICVFVQICQSLIQLHQKILLHYYTCYFRFIKHYDVVCRLGLLTYMIEDKLL